MDRHGQTEVEAFIDICLSVENLIDPYAPHIQRQRTISEAQVEQAELDRSVSKIPAKPYMDRHINPPEFLKAQKKKKQEELQKMKSFPESPERDVLGFLIQHAPLKRWQRDVLNVIRDEAMYFAPQGQTKIMNEGWATYWHTKMMTSHILSDSEVIDYADHHSGTVHMTPGRLNPYKLGVELWRHIEERWDKGRFGKDWLDCDDPRVRAMILKRWRVEKNIQVRKTHNDITFIDTFLTLISVKNKASLPPVLNPAGRWIIDSREFQAVKGQLLNMLATRGTPRIYVLDANAYNRGELLLQHPHEGLDIQLDWAAQVMKNLVHLWGRPIHLDSVIDGKPVRPRMTGLPSNNKPMRRFRSPKMKRKTPPVNTHDSIHDALDALDSGEGTATAPTGNGTVSVEVVARSSRSEGA